jgi:hypothetical protein
MFHLWLNTKPILTAWYLWSANTFKKWTLKSLSAKFEISNETLRGCLLSSSSLSTDRRPKCVWREIRFVLELFHSPNKTFIVWRISHPSSRLLSFWQIHIRGTGRTTWTFCATLCYLYSERVWISIPTPKILISFNYWINIDNWIDCRWHPISQEIKLFIWRCKCNWSISFKWDNQTQWWNLMSPSSKTLLETFVDAKKSENFDQTHLMIQTIFNNRPSC